MREGERGESDSEREGREIKWNYMVFKWGNTFHISFSFCYQQRWQNPGAIRRSAGRWIPAYILYFSISYIAISDKTGWLQRWSAGRAFGGVQFIPYIVIYNSSSINSVRNRSISSAAFAVATVAEAMPSCRAGWGASGCCGNWIKNRSDCRRSCHSTAASAAKMKCPTFKAEPSNWFSAANGSYSAM